MLDNIEITNCIAIGDNAQVTKSFEICIRTTSLEGRTIMTPNERKVIQTVIRRMDFKKI